MVLYNAELSALVMSPLSDFMVSSQVALDYFDGSLSFGIQGLVSTIPVGFTHSTMFVFSLGVCQAVYDWGGYLLDMSGKDRAGEGFRFIKK